MNKFSEFAKDDGNVNLSGAKMLVKNIVGKKIIVYGFRMVRPKYKTEECAQIQFKFIGEDGKEEETEHVLFTGSTVLIKQLKTYEKMMPFSTVIKYEQNRYYTFS